MTEKELEKLKKSKYYQYAIDVINGNIIACRDIILACKRFLNDLERDDLYFDIPNVERVIKFISCIKLSTGKFANKPFKLEPWQEFAIANIFGLKRKSNNLRKYTSAILEVSRKAGKGLDINEIVPTVDGFKKVGDLKEGDVLFSQDGTPTTITYITDIMHKPCYEITFDDDSKVIADDEHNWGVKEKGCDKLIVRTTEEMSKDFAKKRNDNKGYEYKYRVPMNKPVQYKWKELPIEPYALGIGLGDGTIPSIYKTASIKQRLELIRGLMDSNGHCDKRGMCEISQKRKDIAEDIIEILASLGIKAKMIEKIPTINGEPKDKTYRVTFFTDKRMSVFHLKREHERLKDNLNKRMNWKTITNIKKVDSVPTRCLQVDNPSHLFLFGKHYTTTHNTELSAALGLYMLLGDGEASAQVICASNSREQASIVHKAAQAQLKSIDPKGKITSTYRNEIRFPIKNSFMKITSSDATRLDGLNCSAIIYDEYGASPNDELMNVLTSSQGMREQPLTIVISTANYVDGPFRKTVSTCKEIINGNADDDYTFALLYSIDSEDDWDDPTKWIKAQPNLGITVKEDFLLKELEQAKLDTSKEVNFKIKYLNVFTNSSDVWIPEDYILECTQKVDEDKYKGQLCWCGMDLSSVDDLTALDFMWYDEDIQKCVHKTHYFIPKESFESRGDLRWVYENWARQGHFHITEGNVIDYDAIFNELIKARDKYRLYRINYDPWGSAQLAVKLTEAGLPIEPMGQSIGKFSPYAKDYKKSFLEKGMIIDANPINRWCLNNVVIKEDANENIKPTKVNNQKKIDGVIAQIMAYAAYRQTARIGDIYC